MNIFVSIIIYIRKYKIYNSTFCSFKLPKPSSQNLTIVCPLAYTYRYYEYA